MTRIEKIRQMTDEALEDFLSRVADKGNSRDMLLLPGAVRDMPDADLGVYLLALDVGNVLRICDTRSDHYGTATCGKMLTACGLRWLHSEGPLMDGEG